MSAGEPVFRLVFARKRNRSRRFEEDGDVFDIEGVLAETAVVGPEVEVVDLDGFAIFAASKDTAVDGPVGDGMDGILLAGLKLGRHDIALCRGEHKDGPEAFEQGLFEGVVETVAVEVGGIGGEEGERGEGSENEDGPAVH